MAPFETNQSEAERYEKVKSKESEWASGRLRELESDRERGREKQCIWVSICIFSGSVFSHCRVYVCVFVPCILQRTNDSARVKLLKWWRCVFGAIDDGLLLACLHLCHLVVGLSRSRAHSLSLIRLFVSGFSYLQNIQSLVRARAFLSPSTSSGTHLVYYWWTMIMSY